MNPDPNGWTSEPPTVAGAYEWQYNNEPEIGSSPALISITSNRFGQLYYCVADAGVAWKRLACIKNGGLWRRLVPAVEIETLTARIAKLESGLAWECNECGLTSGRTGLMVCEECFSKRVPAVEVERAYREGAHGSQLINDWWADSRAKRILEGKETV